MKSVSDQRLIVALDLPNIHQAEDLVHELGDSVSFYKIGLGLIPVGGFKLVEKLKLAGKKVFLDLKLFDIGKTIENSVTNLKDFNVDFLTVHGDPQVVKSAVKARKNHMTKILAVTLLTSLDRNDLDQALIKKGKILDLVIERARNAFLAGADGVITSPQEAYEIRRLPDSIGKIIVTPGIRPIGGDQNDQKRVSNPKQALINGSDYIVVGRPIYESNNPLEEVKKLIDTLN